MATLSWVPRVTVQVKSSVTPVISTSAYTAQDQVGGVQTLTNVIRQDSNLGYGTAMLTNVKIVDKAKQSAALEIWFFQNSPTMAGSDNAAFDLTDANLVLAGYLGHVVIAATDYSTSTSNAVAIIKNQNIEIDVPSTSTTPSSIYACMKTTGTPTYGSTSDLILTYTFLVD